MPRAISDEAKDERRRMILIAALDEFFEKGYGSARMDDIAARTDISKAALYLYFKNKESLFTELIKELTAPRMASIFAVIDNAPSFREGIETLAKFLPDLIRTSPMPKLLKIMVGESQSFGPIQLEYRENVIDQVLGHFTAFLERHKARGEITYENVDVAAKLVMAPIALNAVWRVLFGLEEVKEENLHTLFQTHAQFMVRALSVQGETNGQ